MVIIPSPRRPVCLAHRASMAACEQCGEVRGYEIDQAKARLRAAAR